LKLLLLGVSCYLLLALSQFASTLVFRLSKDLPINMIFFRSAFPIESEFPPHSMGWLGSAISIFEEVAFRGVILALFLRFYDPPKAILFSALGFGAVHALNMLNGMAPVWVVGQIVSAAIMGLFYGYITFKTGSLLPAMLVHYLGNLFIYPLTAYIQHYASIPLQALLGIISTLGVIPVVLMWLWARFFTSRWLVTRKILLETKI
jgi:membrane protease YdiL (CAAX protease family)